VPRYGKYDERIENAHATGARNYEISRSVGCGATTVTKALKRLGLEPHRHVPKERAPAAPRSAPSRHRATPEEIAAAGEQFVHSGCAYCPWTMTATMTETSAAFARHVCTRAP
jgi:hypothetical protein